MDPKAVVRDLHLHYVDCVMRLVPQSKRRRRPQFIVATAFELRNNDEIIIHGFDVHDKRGRWNMDNYALMPVNLGKQFINYLDTAVYVAQSAPRLSRKSASTDTVVCTDILAFAIPDEWKQQCSALQPLHIETISQLLSLIQFGKPPVPYKTGVKMLMQDKATAVAVTPQMALTLSPFPRCDFLLWYQRIVIGEGFFYDPKDIKVVVPEYQQEIRDLVNQLER